MSQMGGSVRSSGEIAAKTDEQMTEFAQRVGREKGGQFEELGG